MMTQHPYSPIPNDIPHVIEEDLTPSDHAQFSISQIAENLYPEAGQQGVFSTEKTHLLRAKATHKAAHIITCSVLALYGLFALAFVIISIVHGGGTVTEQGTSFLVDAGVFLAPLHTVLAAVAGFYFGTKQD